VFGEKDYNGLLHQFALSGSGVELAPEKKGFIIEIRMRRLH